jgi:hypothetical protein
MHGHLHRLIYWTAAIAFLAASGSSTAEPKLAFSNPTHDFGDIWDVATLPCSFSFINAGDEPLVIQEVAPGCGCTTTTLGKTVYAPGETGVIDATFKPNATGKLKKIVTVLSNDGTAPIQKLALTANVTAFVNASQRIARLPRVQHGAGGETVVRFTPAKPGFVFEEKTKVHGASAKYVTATMIPPAQSDTSDARSFKVSLSPDTPWGDVQAFVTVRGRGATDQSLPQRPHEIKVPVLGSVQGQLRADSTHIALGGVEPGGSFEKRIRLTHRTGRPFQILDYRVSMRPQGVALMLQPLDGGGYDLLLSGQSGSYLGSLGGTVMVRTDVPGEEALRFRTSGSVRHPK